MHTLTLRPQFAIRRAALAAIVAAGALLALPAAAFAHAALEGAVPAPGARLQRAPTEITLTFSESLNRALTRATLTDATTGKHVAVASRDSGRQLILRPRKLPAGAYRVDWHTVSALDGHALEGSISFGVRTKALGSAQAVEQSPVAGSGWLRILVRAVLYALLFFFIGGVAGAALLSRDTGPGGWLLPDELRNGTPKRESPIAAAAWRRTLSAGWLAVGAAVAVALVESAEASGGLSARGAADYLLKNTPGLARVGTVVALLIAALAASRWRTLAAAACAAAVFTLSLSGHANSADSHHSLVVAADYLHATAGAIWLGGIAQIALTWLPRLRGLGRDLRLSLMRGVLANFGRLALPAFIVTVAAAAVNGLIELGNVDQLWLSSYGRVLAAKTAFVLAIAAASFTHALWLRPRLIAGTERGDERRERRHWRLLGSEPLLGIGVLAAAAVLVAFPLPARELREPGEAEAAQAQAACSPSCPLPKPAPDQLSVASHLGPAIVAGWLRRERDSVQGRLRLLDYNVKPVNATPRVPGAQSNSCGPGCIDFRLSAAPGEVRVAASEHGRTFTTTLPTRWATSRSALARRLLERAQATMQHLTSVREHEVITSGPGSLAVTNYQLKAPNRFAYTTGHDVASITIGRRQWTRGGPNQPWQSGLYGGGGPPFRLRSWFNWTSYAGAVRLLRFAHAHRVAELALMDPGTPVWFRLEIDTRTLRVPRVNMIAPGHYMNQRYFAFNRPLTIEAPRER